jgi:hypothetical protein
MTLTTPPSQENSQWLLESLPERAVIHRCGGSAGMAPKSATGFPFNAKRLRTDKKNARTITGGAMGGNDRR